MTARLHLPAATEAPSCGYFKIAGPDLRVMGYPLGVVFTSIPADEVWLWQNPQILDEVLRGYEAAKQGETQDASYLEFVDPAHE